jgi:Fe-Mn family superoxide dismutase
MGTTTTYKARSFDLSDLTGISNETLAMHFKLYEGYVTNTNTLNERIAELISGGELDATKVAAFSELKRRFGFEYNGMVLHEYYFENMQKWAGLQLIRTRRTARSLITGSTFMRPAMLPGTRRS